MNKVEATNVLKEFIETYIKSHGEEDIITVQLDNVDIEAFSTIAKELEKETVSKETYDDEYLLRKELDLKAWKLERKVWSLERIIEDLKQDTLDDAREDFMFDVYNILDFLPTNNEANKIIDVFDRVTSGLNFTKDEILRKIKAKIEALPKTYPFANHFDMYVKVDDVRKIIDKYKKSEEKSENV